jgi:hypothetical protein
MQHYLPIIHDNLPRYIRSYTEFPVIVCQKILSYSMLKISRKTSAVKMASLCNVGIK